MFWTFLAKVTGPVMLLLFGSAVILWPLHKFGLISEKKVDRIMRPLLLMFFGLLGIGMVASLFNDKSSSHGGGRRWDAIYGDDDPMDAIMEQALSEPPPTREQVRDLWKAEDWEYESVDSSVFEEISYNRRTHTAKVTFLSGEEYYYWDVPRDVYNQWIRASSKGRFFHDHIRGHYDEERVE